jgi:hypothetical protein
MTYLVRGFGRYALPQDELAQNAISITASAEDAEYEALNAITRIGRRPAKLTTTSGYWDILFNVPQTIGAYHLIYPNFDDNLDVTLEPNGGTPIEVPIFAPFANGWTKSPWGEFEPQTSDLWRLSINGTNSQPISVLQILLYESLRDLENDVRWGVVEDEEQGDILQESDGGAANIAEVWGPRRSFAGEFALKDDKAAELIVLHRSAHQRIKPWTLIPDASDVSDGWWVRFEETRWSRMHEGPNHHIFPFRVKEVARGLPWP